MLLPRLLPRWELWATLFGHRWEYVYPNVQPHGKMGQTLMNGNSDGPAAGVEAGWIKLKAAATYTGRHSKTLRRAVDSGKLPRRQPGGPRGKLYFLREELDGYMRGAGREQDGHSGTDLVTTSAESLPGAAARG